MFKLALKGLLGYKLRMLLTAFSIIIGVSFVAGTYIFTDSMSSTFGKIFENAYASVDVIVQPETEEFGQTRRSNSASASTVPYSLLEELEDVEGVDEIEGEIGGIAQLVDTEGELIGGTSGAPTLGFSWNKTPSLNPLKLQDGSEAPDAPGEIAIDINTAEQFDLSVGDMIKAQAAGAAEDFTIVGLFTFGDATSLAGATLTAFEFNQAQELFGTGGDLSQISINAQEGVDPETLRDRVASVIGDDLKAVTGDQQQAQDLDQLNEGLGFLNTALLAFAGISIFVGSFIIQNTFRIIVSQRSKELALLRSVGATRKQVVKMVLYEALIVALFASIVGVIVGIGISGGLRAVANTAGLGLPQSELTLLPRTIFVSFAVGIVVTLISALMPAIKASRVSPVEALRDTEAAKAHKSLKGRAIAGLTVTAIGAAALLYGLSGDTGDPLIFVGIGAAIMFIGVSVLAPLVSGPIGDLIAWPLRLRYGVLGRIAKQNAKRTPRRTASTAAALMIGVSLVVFASIFASSVRATIDDVIGDSFPGDISITSKLITSDPFGATFPPEAADEVERLDEVELVSRLKYDFVKLDGREQLIVAVEPETFNDAIALDPNNGSYDGFTKDTVYVHRSVIEGRGAVVGDVITMEFSLTGRKDLTIAGTFEDPFDSPYLLSEETYFENFTNRRDLFVVANVADGVDMTEARDAVANALDKYPTINVQDKNQLISETRKQIDQVLGLLTALLGFSVIIAMLGITNTLTLSVTERTREIGMLRAIGMTRPQVRKMIRAEAIIIAVFGALLGTMMGVFFGWAMLRALAELGFSSFSVPVVQLLIYLVAAAVAGVVAAIMPSYKASRMNILDAINYE